MGTSEIDLSKGSALWKRLSRNIGLPETLRLFQEFHGTYPHYSVINPFAFYFLRERMIDYQIKAPEEVDGYFDEGFMSSKKIRSVKIYEPQNEVPCGKFKGEDFRFAYMFDPEYVQWCLLNVDSFAIDIRMFENLHTNQIPVGLTMRRDALPINNELVSLADYIRDYLACGKEYVDPPERPNLYQFSIEAMSSLLLKVRSSAVRKRNSSVLKSQRAKF